MVIPEFFGRKIAEKPSFFSSMIDMREKNKFKIVDSMYRKCLVIKDLSDCLSVF
jgi:hypothetical protein